MKTIAVDFDGVIHDMCEGYKDGEIYGNVIEGAYEHLKILKEKGYKIVVFTTRTNFDDVSIWLDRNGICFDEVTNIKPKEAFIFIDDRGYRFTNWQDVYKLFP